MSFTRQVASGRAMLATEVAGSGDPIVFLHAGGCDRRMWRAQVDGVSASSKAIAYDRRGCGATRAEAEAFSAVADLMAVVDAAADGKPAVLVGCSEGGRVALDAVLKHPSRFRGLVLVAPSVTGAPVAAYPPEAKGLMAQLEKAQEAGDLDRVAALKAHLWLDGPLEPEGRVGDQARALFLDMQAVALRSPPVGASVDAAPAYQRLGEVAVPTLVIQGALDFPHIQDRSRHIAMAVPNGSHHELADTAHLSNLERPADVTRLLQNLISRC